MTERLLGVVLCGGQSKRMGTDKASLVDANGQTFLDATTRRLDQICDQVWLSHRDDQVRTHKLIQRSVTDSGEHGPLAAIAGVLAAANDAGWSSVLFCPIDLPHLTTDDLRELVAGHRGDVSITVASFSRVQPLLGIYATSLRSIVAAVVASGELGVNRFLGAQPHHIVSLPESSGRNVNRPSDHRQ